MIALSIITVNSLLGISVKYLSTTFYHKIYYVSYSSNLWYYDIFMHVIESKNKFYYFLL